MTECISILRHSKPVGFAIPPELIMRMLFVGLLAMLSGAASAQKTSQVTSPRGTQVNDIPILGLGTWQIHTNGANVTEIIASAIQSGYRLLDCAFSYNNQKQIAVGIKEGLRRTGLSRKDLWITSKLWNTKYVLLPSHSW